MCLLHVLDGDYCDEQTRHGLCPPEEFYWRGQLVQRVILKIRIWVMLVEVDGSRRASETKWTKCSLRNQGNSSREAQFLVSSER